MNSITTCCLLFLIAGTFLYGQPFDNDKYLDTTGINIYTQQSGRITMDAQGNPGILWIEEAYFDDFWVDRLLYSRSTDHGNSFESVLIDTFGCYQFLCELQDPALLYDSENNLWLTCIYNFEFSWDLHIKKSTDGGESFTSLSLLMGLMPSRYSITSDNEGNFYILWASYYEILRCTKINNGNLQDTATVFISAPEVGGMDICSEAGKLYAVFEGKINDKYKALFTKSTDGGLSFSAPSRIDLTNDSANTGNCQISFWNNKICVLWTDDRTGEYALYYSESADYGISFSPAVKISLGEDPVNSDIFLSGNNERMNITWSSLGDVYFSSKVIQNSTFSTPVKVGNPSFLDYYQFSLGTATDNEGYTYLLFCDNRLDTNYRGNFRVFLSRTQFPMRLIEDNSLNTLDFSISDNYPNPFNPSTRISYSLPEYSGVIIKVYDILGKEVTTLVNEEKPAGIYDVTWNAAGLPSGVYFYQLKAVPHIKKTDSFIDTKKMILIK